jgi:hypothetical protein
MVVGLEANDMAKPSCWFGRMCRTAMKGTVEQAHPRVKCIKKTSVRISVLEHLLTLVLDPLKSLR